MKIGLCGTMSVGKTTLVNALKNLPEFKDYQFRTERSKYLRDMGIPLNTDSTLKGQIVFAAERAAELMQEKIITDRTVIDVMAFCELSKSMDLYEKIDINNMLLHLIKDYDVIFYVVHWILLYCSNQNSCMHDVISSFALSILSAKTDDDFKKKDIVPAISLFFMYCAFYLDPKLEHLAFQPWWCVSLRGLRYHYILFTC